MNQKSKPLPQLEKDSELYKMTIPVEVEKKIQYLCKNIYDTEWSGVLLYDYKGSVEKGDLEVICSDVILMDIGTSSFTEYKMSADVINYMAEHPELLGCQIGQIHSHHKMAAFFSGTDLNTLQDEGIDRNHFVSLIVNNSGEYVAAITSKLNVKETFTYNYKTFNDEVVSSKNPTTNDRTIIRYNYFAIIIETLDTYNNKELEDRINEVKKLKENNKKSFKTSTTNFSKKSYYNGTQPSLFDSIDNSYDYNFHRTISETKVQDIALQLLTGSTSYADYASINPVKWASEMIPLLNKKFGKNIDKYEEWAESFIEEVLTTAANSEIMSYDDIEYFAELSYKVKRFLLKLPQNIYIESLINILNCYAIY